MGSGKSTLDLVDVTKEEGRTAARVPRSGGDPFDEVVCSKGLGDDPDGL